VKKRDKASRTRTNLLWVLLTATVGAAIPVVVYFIVVGQNGKDESRDQAETPDSNAAGALERLGRESALYREPLSLEIGRSKLFEAAELLKDAASTEARTKRASVYLSPLFLERKANLDNAIVKLFGALPAGTNAIRVDTLSMYFSQPDASNTPPDLVMGGMLSMENNAFKIAGEWLHAEAECSMELIYTFKSGLLFATYDCPEAPSFSAPFLSENYRLSVKCLSITSGSFLEIRELRIFDSRTKADVLSVDKVSFSSQQAVDRRLFARGLGHGLLGREKNWKLEFDNVRTDLSLLHILPVFDSLASMPAAGVSIDRVEADSAGNVRLVKPEVVIPEAFMLKADLVDFATDGARKIFSIENPFVEEEQYGLTVSTARAVVEQDEFKTFRAEVDGYLIGVSPNPLKLAKLLSLRTKADEILAELKQKTFEIPPLVIRAAVPDMKLSAVNGTIKLPLLQGKSISGVAIQALVRGGCLERGEANLCMGSEKGKCEELDFKAGISTDAVGNVKEAALSVRGTLPVRYLQKRLPAAVRKIGGLEVDCTVTAVEPGSRFKADFNIAVREATLFHKRLAREPITFPLVRIEGEARIDTKMQTVELSLPKVQVDRVYFRVAADIQRYAGLPSLKLSIDFPEQNCHSLLRSAPRGFAPLLSRARLTGSLWFKAGFQVDLKEIRKSIKLELDGDWDRCEAISLGPRFDVEKLNQPDFVFDVSVNGEDLGLQVGPGTTEYVGLARIPYVTQAAAYGTEDLSFFKHQGFRLGLIRRAIILYLERGYFAYGGSTISQQLVKNLFLTRYKTLSRKFQEAVIVWEMERKVSKERIFELYLNCIEYGPRIWGINKAARTYFGKHPSTLTPIESAFLMGLKPDPAYGYLQYRRGRLNQHWRKNLNRVLKRLWDMGAMKKQAYETAMRTRLRFKAKGPGPAPPAPAGVDEDRPVREGQEVL